MAAGHDHPRATGLIRDMALVAASVSAPWPIRTAWATAAKHHLHSGRWGALNAVFIPQLVRHMNNDEDGGHGFANRLLRVVTLITLALDDRAVLAAP